jgi:hypothetical protein
MALVLKDRVKTTTTTTGTGTVTLGSAATGYQSFAAITPNGEWDISKVTYIQNFSVFAQESNPLGLFFKPDGLKMYVTGSNTDAVYEYNLSTAWNVSTAVYSQSFSISAQIASAQGLFFKPDGTKMYVVDSVGNDVNEYTLSSGWDISTASYLQSFSVATQETDPFSLFFKPDGLKMYVAGSNNRVYEYDLSSAWNISTASFLQSGSVGSAGTDTVGLSFKPDGLRLFVSALGDGISQFNLTSAWNISTATFVRINTLDNTNVNSDLYINPDGLKMYVLFDDVSTAVVNEYDLGGNDTYYVISDSTNWETGQGFCSSSGATLARTQVFESSNGDALVNFPAGTKDVIVGYPSTATAGGVPNCDNSSIGTDLSGWSAFQAALQSGVTGGTLFGNNNTNGIVSTYSLVYTAGSYYGGVLAPNGDIHFVPFNANRGQKISVDGVVSTYSLVYTVSQAYRGGVLASNGDIHFVPNQAARGQKINSSGVVSTYSLLYSTASGAYLGGVLAPNGDIYFVPSYANRGQKVSAAGVVSTYSLVYTTLRSYGGGVLSPNGDIHFIPSDATVGQKISAAGVVSTYSLVYTRALAYSGGVLAPNGDIHFVPAFAAVGQKISSAGVVSTYSLVYTNGDDAYYGGVLAPNGDIHFVPNKANRGQKISSVGVVSTYSLVYTALEAYYGGVLAPNGDIHFIPNIAVRGQKISTNPGQPLGLGVCLSSFLNKF